MTACPYEVPQFDEAANIVKKCDACAYLRAKGKNPACVDACPNRALDFGDLDELKAKYGSDLVSKVAVMPESETNPSVLIKSKDFAVEGEFTELPM